MAATLEPPSWDEVSKDPDFIAAPKEDQIQFLHDWHESMAQAFKSQPDTTDDDTRALDSFASAERQRLMATSEATAAMREAQQAQANVDAGLGMLDYFQHTQDMGDAAMRVRAKAEASKRPPLKMFDSAQTQVNIDPGETLGPPKPTQAEANKAAFLQREREFYDTKPSISEQARHTLDNFLHPVTEPEKPLISFGEPTPGDSVAAGVIRGGVNVIEGLTTPTNLGLMATIGGAPAAVARMASAVFAGQAVHGLGEQIPEAIKAVKEGRDADAAQIITEAAGGAAIGALALKHAATEAPRAAFRESPEVLAKRVVIAAEAAKAESAGLTEMAAVVRSEPVTPEITPVTPKVTAPEAPIVAPPEPSAPDVTPKAADAAPAGATDAPMASGDTIALADGRLGEFGKVEGDVATVRLQDADGNLQPAVEVPAADVQRYDEGRHEPGAASFERPADPNRPGPSGVSGDLTDHFPFKGRAPDYSPSTAEIETALASGERETVPLDKVEIAGDKLGPLQGQYDKAIAEHYRDNPSAAPVILVESMGAFFPLEGNHRLVGAAMRGDAAVQAVVMRKPVEPKSRDYSILTGLSSEELGVKHAESKAFDRRLVTELFGEEGAKRYRSLLLRENNLYPKVADAAYEKRAEMEAKLTESQRNRLFQETQEFDPEELRDLKDSVNFIENAENEKELGEALKFAATNFAPDKPPSTFSEAKALSEIRAGARLIESRGWDSNVVAQEMLQSAAARFSDPADAAIMLSRLKKYFKGDQKLPRLRQGGDAAVEAVALRKPVEQNVPRGTDVPQARKPTKPPPAEPKEEPHQVAQRMLDADDAAAAVAALKGLKLPALTEQLQKLGMGAVHNAKSAPDLLRRFAAVAEQNTKTAKAESAKKEKTRSLTREIEEGERNLARHDEVVADGGPDYAGLRVGENRADLVKRISDAKSELSNLTEPPKVEEDDWASATDEAPAPNPQYDALAKARQRETTHTNPVEPTPAEPMPKTTSGLAKAAKGAAERINKRGGKMTMGVDPAGLLDHAIVGAHEIVRGAKSLVAFTARMVRRFGEAIRPHVEAIWAKAKEIAASINRGPFREGFGESGSVLSVLKSAKDRVKKIGDLEPFHDARRAVLVHSDRLQKSFGEARRSQKELREALTTEEKGNAATLYREAAGDTTKLAEWAALAHDPRIRQGAEDAQKLTPEEVAVIGKAGRTFDKLGKRAETFEILKAGVQNYVPHLMEEVGKPGAPATAGSRKLRDTTRHGLKRVFDTFFDADQAGWRAKTLDLRSLAPMYVHEINTVIAAKQLVADAVKGKASDGSPLVVPDGEGSAVAGVRPNQMVLTFPKGAPKDARAIGYKKLPGDHPALRGWNYVGKDTAGNPVMKVDLLVHPELYGFLKAAVGESQLKEHFGEGFVHGVDVVSQTAKQTMLGFFSPFHQVQLGVHSSEHRVNALSNLPNPDPSMNPRASYAAQHGLMLFPDRASRAQFMEGLGGTSRNLVVMGLRHIPGIREAGGRLVAEAADHYQDYLFHHFIPALKLKVFEHALERNKERFSKELADGRASEDQVAHETAKQMNAAFGHLNYADMQRDPSLRHISSWAALAPDFLEARGRFVAQALKGKAGREQLQALALGALVVGGIAQTINYFTDDGKLHWDDPFTVYSGNRKFSIRTVQGDLAPILKDMYASFRHGRPTISASREWLYGRLNPVITKPMVQLGSGVNYRGERMDAVDVAVDTARAYIPITIRPFVGADKAHPVSKWEQFLGAAGFHMSRYSPLHDVYGMANEWKKAHGIESDKGVYPVSKYQQLRYALEDNNQVKAAAEVEKLKKGGMATIKIKQGFRESMNSNFTDSKQHDAEFAESLSKEDRQTYDAAIERRKWLYWRLVEVANQTAKEGDPVAPAKRGSRPRTTLPSMR